MNSLNWQLQTFLDSMVDRVTPEKRAILNRAEQQRTALDLPHNSPQPDDPAPDFTLPDQDGRAVSLRDALAHGPVVLSFFRGGWCPFSAIALRAMERVRPELERAGAGVIAVSPQLQAQGGATVERNGLGFPVLSDAGLAVARRYGLVWQLEPEHRAFYLRLGHDLPRINGAPGWELPVPAGYVIGRDGRVVLAHADPRITSWMEPAAALAAVRALQDVPAK